MSDELISGDVIINRDSYNYVERHIHRCPHCGKFYHCDELTCRAHPYASFVCAEYINGKNCAAAPSSE